MHLSRQINTHIMLHLRYKLPAIFRYSIFVDIIILCALPVEIDQTSRKVICINTPAVANKMNIVVIKQESVESHIKSYYWYVHNIGLTHR